MTDEQALETEEDKHPHRAHRGAPPSIDKIYLLGAIGAGVYYWQRADENQEKALGVLKALIWPATLVYEAFDRLKVD